MVDTAAVWKLDLGNRPLVGIVNLNYHDIFLALVKPDFIHDISLCLIDEFKKYIAIR